MHWGCFSFFECCQLSDLTENSVPSILDIGSYDINGSLKYLFPNSDYTGIDLAEGPNVDVVASGDKYNTDKRYDITLSCECFEHNPQYLQTFQNMIDLTKANGLVIFTCATTGRPEHGTKNTSPHSSLASQGVSSDYYKNLVKEDFDQFDLDAIFSSYSFYTNTYSNDLYFIGRKLGSENNDTLPSVDKIDGVAQILELASKLYFIESSYSTSSNEVIQELIDEVYSNYTLSNLLLTRLMGYLIRIGDYDKALKFGELALGYHFNQVANLVFQARCHFKKGNLEQANELMIEVSNLP
jgi:SAM-dependent methyltransferase